MRSRAGSTTRAGLFLLFVVVLAMLAPLYASGERSTSYRTGGVSEHSEHRETEKLRERLPSVAATRRGHERGSRRWAVLNSHARQLLRALGEHCATKVVDAVRRTSSPSHEWGRYSHSRSALQVYRV